MDPADDAPADTIDPNQRTLSKPFDPVSGPIEAIVDLVAALEGCSVVDLPPFYHVADPDSLTRLFQPRSGRDVTDHHFECTYEGYRVEIHGEGYVKVSRPTHPAKVTETLE